MGFLSLIPIKDWIYGGIILALLVDGSIALHLHNIHEQAIGQQRIEAADKKLADEVKAHNQDLENAAIDTDAAIEVAYEKGKSDAPVRPAPSVLCLRPSASRGGSMPASGAGSGGESQGSQQGIPASADGGQDQIDIGPPLTVIGKDADVQIKALQADVEELLKEMDNGRK